MILGLTPLLYQVDHVNDHHPITFASGPKYSVIDKNDNFKVVLDVHGLKESDLKVSIHINRIEVTGDHKTSADKGRKLESTQWTRTFQIDPKALDLDTAKATLCDGILTVNISKRPKHTPKEVEILTDESTSNELEKAYQNKDICFETFIVPGIRKSDLKVFVHDDGIVDVAGSRMIYDDKMHRNAERNIKYSKNVQFDKKVFDINAMKAFLENGILTVFAPKKPMAEPTKILICTERDSLDGVSNNQNMFAITMDIPGTKPKDLSVKYCDDNVIEICGFRTHGSSKENTQFKKLYMIDAEIVDVSKITAHLIDGVLTISAPYLMNQQSRILEIETSSDKTDELKS